MVKTNRSQRTAEAGVHLAGSAFEQLGLAFRVQRENDFGIDAHVELIVDDSATGRLIAVQVKSGPSYLVEQSEASYVFRADSGHVQYWLNHSLPEIVCICDTDNNVVYWQSIAQDTAISTGDGFKFMVPKHQTVSAPSLAALTHIFTPVVSHDKYTILRTSDQSHALPKRYSFHVVLNGTFTKREVASIVRQLTIDGAKRRYYRNNLTERTWGDAAMLKSFGPSSIQVCKTTQTTTCSVAASGSVRHSKSGGDLPALRERTSVMASSWTGIRNTSESPTSSLASRSTRRSS